MTRKIHEVHGGIELSVMRPLDSKSKRIFPEAEVSSKRILGATTSPPSQRELETAEIPPDQIPAVKGQALSEAPAGRRRRLGAALAVGIVAWLAAIFVGYFALRSPQSSPPPTEVSEP